MTTKAPPRDRKDRARPFSKKHRRYWLPVTGGMILIGAINVGIGMCSYDPPSDRHEKIELVMPKSPMWNTGEPVETGSGSAELLVPAPSVGTGSGAAPSATPGSTTAPSSTATSRPAPPR